VCIASMSYSDDMLPPDRTLVREFKRRAERALPGRVVRVLLYGSRARGDARPDSDWDVAVFLAGPPTPQDRRALSDIGFDLMMESGQHLQPVALDASRSIDDSSFLKNLHEDGIAA
jgi:predicted nucleotidyltransferase